MDNVINMDDGIPTRNYPPLDPIDENGIVWCEPQPLKEKLLPVPAFDNALLPESLKDWVIDLSERKDHAPPDFAAVGAMVALGILLGRKVGIKPKRYDDWGVIPNVWGMVIGRPSLKKSPTLDDVTRPMRSFESGAKKDFEADLQEYVVNVQLDDLQQKEATNKAKKAIAKGDHSSAKMYLEDAVENVPDKPTRRRYLVNDSTVEKLGELLNENPTGLLLFRDELTGWLSTLDREDRKQDRTFYMEAWNGAGTFTFDRIGRGTVDVNSNTLSVVGGIQPGKLTKCLSDMRGGSGDDGLFQRLQLMVYPDRPKFKAVDRSPDENANEKALKVFEEFRDIPYMESETMWLRFSDGAQRLWNEWYTQNGEFTARQECEHLESHFAKYPSLIASLALIIHVAQDDDLSEVSEDATRKAIAWGEYLTQHAKRVYALLGDNLEGARSLLSKLKDLPNPFRNADFNNKGWSGLNTKEERELALEVLEEHGYLAVEQIETNGRPKCLHHINPKVLGEKNENAYRNTRENRGKVN